MNPRPCNLGFIGCGELMCTQHIQNAHKSPLLAVHTLCDIDEERLRLVAGRYPPRRVTTDYRALLADPEVELVVIAMDPALHVRFALEALEAGKHVYVEKPLGESPAEARRVARRARRAGRFVAVGFNRRFAPAYRELRPLLAGRERSALLYYRIADHERGRRAGTRRLHVEVCHVFDVLCWLLGSEPVEVFCAGGGFPNDEVVVLRFQDGSVAAVLSSGRAEIDLPKEHLEAIWDFRAVVVEDFVEARFFHLPGRAPLERYRGVKYDGELGDHDERLGAEGLEALYEIRRRSSRAWELHDAGGEPDPADLGLHINYIVDKGWRAALEEAGRAAVEGRPPANATALDAARANAVAGAAARSARTGRAVRLRPGAWRL